MSFLSHAWNFALWRNAKWSSLQKKVFHDQWKHVKTDPFGWQTKAFIVRLSWINIWKRVTTPQQGELCHGPLSKANKMSEKPLVLFFALVLMKVYVLRLPCFTSEQWLLNSGQLPPSSPHHAPVTLRAGESQIGDSQDQSSLFVITACVPSVASMFIPDRPVWPPTPSLFLTGPLNQSAGQLFQGEAIVSINQRSPFCLFHLALLQSGYVRLHCCQVRHGKQKSAAPPGTTT